MNTTYFNRSRQLEMADRKIMHMISKASSYLRERDEYQEYADILMDADEDGSMQEMADLYWTLAQAEIAAAKHLIWFLEDVSEISVDDWNTINACFNWFGCPAEYRTHPINWIEALDNVIVEIGGSK